MAGVDEAKEELQEIVEYLRDPERFSKLGARPPKGVLLVGPPGTGKTLLAKAVAGEAGVPFFSTSASEFVELYVGMGALRVRQLFQEARRVPNGAAIVFIDEIDAVAKDREGGGKFKSSGNDEREQTLNQLLTELDGFNSESGVVICIAATNRPDVLDPALLRPGRFDRRVPVERPDRVGREQILTVHIENNGTLPARVHVYISCYAHCLTRFSPPFVFLQACRLMRALISARWQAKRQGLLEPTSRTSSTRPRFWRGGRASSRSTRGISILPSCEPSLESRKSARFWSAWRNP